MYIYIYIYIYTYIQSSTQFRSIITLAMLAIASTVAVVAPAPLNYAQSAYWYCGFPRVRLEHNLNLKGWNSHVHRDILRIFPESLTQAKLVGTMLVGRLGVTRGPFGLARIPPGVSHFTLGPCKAARSKTMLYIK